jgi:glycosyltransferase involved in cell wall biosynthesis
MVKFSVLIANYNNAPYLNQCLESVFVQTYQDFEVIIIDDGSNDSSAEIIQKWCSKDKRISSYFNRINKGCGYSKMLCVEKSSGEIAAFLDPDDALACNAIF